MDSLREGGLWEWFDLAAPWCLLKQGFFTVFSFSHQRCPLCGHNPAVNSSLVGLLLHQDRRNEGGGHPGSRQNTDPHLSLGTSLVAQVVKHLPAHAGDPGLIPGSGRSPGEGNGNSLQYSCLENPMDRGAWRATVYGVARVGHDWAAKPQSPLRGHSSCGVHS